MEEQDSNSADQQTNDFLARLGLKFDPFPAEPDSFYYENPDLMQRLDMIQHLIGFSNQMIFIIGENGIGKTSMLERLEYYAPDHWRICRIQANPLLNTPVLLRQLTSGFELEINADADDLFQVYSEALQDHIETLERAMLTPVVLIDDAHELPVDAFTLLFGFMQQEGGHSRMKMALFCEPEINTMLDSPQLKTLSQNLTHQLEIPSFNEQQTGEYLEQRLQHAGLSGDFPFTADTVHKIYKQSGGIAGKIHTLAQQALLNEDAHVSEAVSFPVVDEVLDFEEPVEEEFPAAATYYDKKAAPVGRRFQSWQIGAVAAVLALLAGILWLTSQLGGEPESSIAEEIPLDITPAAEKTEKPEATPRDSALFDEPTLPEQTAATENTAMVDEASENEEGSTAEPASKDESIADSSSPASTTPQPEEKQTPDPLDEFVQTLEKENKHSPEPSVTPGEKEVVVMIDDNGNPQLVETKKPGNTPSKKTENQEPVKKTAVETVKTQSVDKAATSVETRQTSFEEKLSIPGVRDGNWLRNQEDKKVVLQLLGTHDEEALKKILRENELGDDIAWFETTHENEPWYVIVKGPFPDRSTATASIASLPRDIKKRKPWPRTIASVKQAMDKASHH